MTDEDSEADAEESTTERVTSPMQSFGSRDVAIGLIVFAVGALFAFLLPFVF
jgi:hypothetical protein